MAWAILLALAVGLAALPVWLENRRTPVGEAQRRGSPGGFAGLSDGVTHYRWFGPEGGRPVVLIHGLTTSSYVFGGIISELQIQGFRILAYDLFGRGLSDRPTKSQTRSFFICQLRELLQELQVHGQVMLVGYSMGGAIAQELAINYPNRVSSLLLVSTWARFNNYAKTVYENLKHVRASVRPEHFTELLQLWIFAPPYYEKHLAELQQEKRAERPAYRRGDGASPFRWRTIRGTEPLHPR